MAEVQNLERLKAKLDLLAKKLLPSGEAKPSVIVGYTAAYAIFVHENLEAKHGAAYNAAYIKEVKTKVSRGKNKGQTRVQHVWSDLALKMGYDVGPGGAKVAAKKRGENQQAKFLEQPARELNNSGELGRIVSGAVAKGAPLNKALIMAGLRIQRESQQIVPVDTGALKASAFTEQE